jgi:hypothetical protein
VIRLRMRQSLRNDEGVAMLFVIAIGLVVAGFVVAMLSSTLQAQTTTRVHRNVTSALGAAEAGLDEMVYQLGMVNGANTNWSTFPASWSGSDAAHMRPWGTSTAGAQTWITPEVVGGTATGNLVVWSKGTFGGNTRTVRAVVQQAAPPAFDYSMFASKGIDIHHHGSSWLSPLVTTTSVHSNGYINLDYSSSFTVNTMEAVGNINFQKGGGSTYGGSIPAGGYNWYDPFNGLCFPGQYTPTVAGTCAGTGTKNGVAYSGPANYNPNAVIAGTIQANSVTLGSHGQVLPENSAVTDSGYTLKANQFGDIVAASASINGSSYTPANFTNCVNSGPCGKGASATAGQVSGSLKLSTGYAPAVIPFPSVNFATTYRPKATAEGTANHRTQVFTSGGNFLSSITNLTANNGVSYYQNIASDGTLSQWSPGDPPPGAILLDGDWDITGGTLQLQFNSLKGMVNSATGTSGPAPIIIVRGSLVVEAGGITLQSPLAVVGAGNPLNFVNPYNASTNTALSIDTSKFLSGGSAVMPGILAAGGSVDSSDYDMDAPWTSGCNCYEPSKAAPVYIRGLVYSASWNGTSSTPQNQHFHNGDPKNLQVLYGAQVGADLHDCNNFQFTYDPVVKKAFGFGGGTVKILDYQELGS